MGKWLASTKLMILLVIVLAIQAFPGALIITFVLLLPLWAGVIVNLILLAMLYEGLTGLAGKAYVYIPIAVYGLYFTLFAAGYLDFYLYKWKLERLNTAQSGTVAGNVINLRHRSLVPRHSRDLSGEYVMKLLTNYRIGEAYSTSDGAGTQFHSVIRQDCREVIADIKKKEYTRSLIVERKVVPNLCILTKNSRLPALATHLSITTSAVDRLVWWGTINRLVSEGGGAGSQIELQSLSAEIIFLWPYAFIGCFLNSARARWECEFEMYTMRLNGGPTIVQALATLLRLEPRTDS